MVRGFGVSNIVNQWKINEGANNYIVISVCWQKLLFCCSAATDISKLILSKVKTSLWLFIASYYIMHMYVYVSPDVAVIISVKMGTTNNSKGKYWL